MYETKTQKKPCWKCTESSQLKVVSAANVVLLQKRTNMHNMHYYYIFQSQWEGCLPRPCSLERRSLWVCSLLAAQRKLRASTAKERGGVKLIWLSGCSYSKGSLLFLQGTLGHEHWCYALCYAARNNLLGRDGHRKRWCLLIGDWDHHQRLRARCSFC